MPERGRWRRWWHQLRQRSVRARNDAGLTGHPWRRPQPVSRTFGFDRGTPIDRAYIESFLGAHADDILGRVLEVGDDTYTRRFGRDVAACDVIHQGAGAPPGALIVDLLKAPTLPSGAYDCAIVTQTLQHLTDPGAAAVTLHRILRPGGVLLVSVPGISQISRFDAERWGDYWRFTSQSLHAVLARTFGDTRVEVVARGSAWTAVALLQGLAYEDLQPGELDWRDPDYEVVVLARAVK